MSAESENKSAEELNDNFFIANQHEYDGGAVIMEIFTYNESEYRYHTENSIDALMKYFDPNKINWINIDGIHDTSVINIISNHFNMHTLLIDDILQTKEQAKAEEYDDHLFFRLQMLYKIDGSKIDYEQMSFVLGKNFLITFQEKEGDLFDSLRERIKLDLGKVRKQKADYLFYRMLDIVVDNYYVILSSIGERIENLEDTIYEQGPENEVFVEIQQLKKEVIYLRKAVFPLREAVNKVVKDEYGFIENENTRYFHDVYEHVIHLIDSLDTYKDLGSGLLDTYVNMQNSRMNEVMKVLTIIATIFIPLTFIAGVYGMNFDYMPELALKWAYPAVWLVMCLVVLVMLAYFKRKKWL
ncbi:MAG TPA: magnesium/cobalt transporter CorA [Cyclobacteriaceae bacterium]|nr:magnesium/cobalt transporter CorA [Cyclobacteriaceae bacterium]